MKKISLFVATLLLVVSLHASVFIAENPTIPTADKVMVPLFNSGKTIPLSDFMKLTPSEYKTMTGTKLSFKEKVSLKLFQRHFKNAINKDGSVNLEKLHQDEDDMNSFHFGWFALGFFLGLIGLIIALVISDDKRQGRIKWTAIGLGAAVVLSLLFLL